MPAGRVSPLHACLMESESSNYSGKNTFEEDFTYSVSVDEIGWRLDHFLVHHLPGVSRSQLNAAIKAGSIRINGETAKAGRKLHRDDTVHGQIHEKAELVVTPQEVDFQILFEDEYLLLVAKPPHLVVHPAAGNHDNTLVNGLVYHCRKLIEVGDPVRPGIVHRLDKDTSGIMVVAKTGEVHRRLVEIFRQRKIIKKYHALIHGIVEESRGRIVASIGRHPVNRKKMAILAQGGRHAASRWLLKRYIQEKYSFVEVEIETGRTHQIRVHMASIGHPVAGDEMYGPGKDNRLFPRQMLHSSELHFTHPITGRQIHGKAPLHDHFLQFLNPDINSGGNR